MGPGLSDFFGKLSQNSPKPVLILCILFILLKVVSYYDLSVLSMPVMRFRKKWMGWVGGWGELFPGLLYQVFKKNSIQVVDDCSGGIARCSKLLGRLV